MTRPPSRPVVLLLTILAVPGALSAPRLAAAREALAAPALESAYESLRPAAAENVRLLAASVPAAPRAAQEPQQEKPKDAECRTCWRSGFKPITERAKAVDAWEKKKIDVDSAKIAADVAAFFALFGGPAGMNAFRDAQSKYEDRAAELRTLRDRAERLGGLVVKDGIVVKITLVQGADYTVEP